MSLWFNSLVGSDFHGSSRTFALHAAAAALYLALALGVTFPLWLAPAGRIASYGDPLLNSYILWWSQHAIFHQLGDF